MRTRTERVSVATSDALQDPAVLGPCIDALLADGTRARRRGHWRAARLHWEHAARLIAHGHTTYGLAAVESTLVAAIQELRTLETLLRQAPRPPRLRRVK